MPEFVYYIIIAIFLFLSMAFSSADTAFSVTDADALENKLKKKPNFFTKIALKLAKNYEFTISTILFGNNLSNIGASSFVVILGTQYDPFNGAFISTVILTVFVIIFCEFIPKALSNRFAIKMCEIHALPLIIFEYLVFIFVWPISKLFKLIGKPFKKKSMEEDEINDDVLQEMVDTIEDEGLFEEGEAELVRSAIDISDTEVYEIMTPRVDCTFIDEKQTVSEILNDQDIYNHSRIPVYRKTPDDIIGILPVKALLKAKLKNPRKIDYKKLMYEPLFVPRNTIVLDLLEDMRNNKVHIAIVKDEFGGTDGIVTMEDILETIVGDIFDETDKVKHDVVEVGKDSYIIDGDMNLEEFFELIDYRGDFDTSYETVGGFCLEFTEGFAKKGEEFDFGGYHFRILRVDEFTVEKVKVDKIKEETED